jgi:amino acid adenylation domain-containing protein
MAGFHALLWRYTGQDEILVGTPIAGRTRVELEPLVGLFVNMVPIRTSFRDAPTFRELVRQVRESSFAAYTHQDLPFDKLVEELQPKRAPGRNPIFQAILAFQNATPELGMAKVRVPTGAPASADSRFDLEVHLRDSPSGLSGSLVFSPDLFAHDFASRLADRLSRLLRAALASPDAQLASLPLLDPAEFDLLVRQLNSTASPFPLACIHHLFARQEAARPDAIAIESASHHLSYAALGRAARRLAGALRRRGLAPDRFAALLIGRSPELIVSLLGVACAGGAYVPLNPSDPPPRRRLILQDCGARLLLTTRADAGPDDYAALGLEVVYVDELLARGDPPPDDAAPEPSAPHAPDAVPDNLAYMTYTSGSTGEPKGVLVTHRNVAKLVRGADYAEFDPSDVFLQFAPISFDASTFEVWGALLNGARLVVAPPHTPSLSELGELVARSQITTLWLTAGLFHQFVDAGVAGAAPALRQLLAGGDALSPAHVARAAEQLEGCRLVNGYGPTETTTFACCHTVRGESGGGSVPIGRPITNTTAYVVNWWQPAGVGERGELYVGGEGVGRGYHARAGLTAERFVPDPFGGRGGRLYRTGDAARWGADGELRFMGRLDAQVKVSGYRVEPGEVEAALGRHAGVGAAVVTAREEGGGGRRLIGYVVGRGGEPPPASELLRAYLRESLPEYMVPSVCVVLDALPLTPNGKVDKAALPAPQLSLSRSGREYVAPRTGLQQQLVDIWEELFKIHPIGLTDNFFELGGHSLLMVMLVARVEERLGKRVAMGELFREPTIEHLSELVGHGKGNLLQSLIVPMQAEGTRLPMFSPHAAGGQVWCYTDLVRYIGDDQPFYGVQAREPEAGLVASTDIEAMASDYVAAVRDHQPTGPYLLCGWSMGGVIAFEMARQLRAQGEEIAMLVLLDSQVQGRGQPEHNWAALLSIFALDLGLTGDKLSTPLEELSALAPMAQLRRVWMEAKNAGLVPKEMTLVEFRKMFDTFKINANTLHRYAGGEYDGPMTLFAAEESVKKDFFLKPEEVSHADPLRGWKRFAMQGVDLRITPGNHFTMIREPHVQVLAEELRRCVDETLLRLRQ